MGEMGDAEEIGRELARIHKPWLGYLWTVSKLALWAVVCMLLFNQWMPMTGGQKESWLGDGGMERFTRRSYNAEIVEYCELPLPEERTVGEYTFAVTWAELWTGHGEAQTGRMVYLILEEHHRRPRETLVIGRRMWAEDDQGSRILSLREYTDGAPESFDSQCIHSGVCLEAGPFWMRYEFIVPLTGPEAEGITLRYDWLGADLSIPIALKEATS